MMVDTTIYGYAHDGGVYHVDCAGDPLDAHDDTWTRLYYLDNDDPHGMTCDECGAFIFEPVEQHAINADGSCDYGCDDYCGERESCALHTAPETADDPDDLPLMAADIDPPTLAIWIDLQAEWADRTDR